MTDIPGGITPEVKTVANNWRDLYNQSPISDDLNKMKAEAAREIYERAEAALEDRIVSILSRSTFRLAEDQMQRLMRCIIAANWLNRTGQKESFLIDWRVAENMLKEEPKPEPAPGQVKVSGEGWIDPEKALNTWLDYKELKEENGRLRKENERLNTLCLKLSSDCNALKSAEDTLKVQIECLQSNLDAANDRALLARQENERLKAQIADYQKQHEMTMGVGDGDGNLFVHGSQEAIHRVREYLSAIEQLVKEKHELKAQIPKERLKVDVWYHVATGYSLHLLELKSLLICNLASREDAIQWAEDRGLEVVE